MLFAEGDPTVPVTKTLSFTLNWNDNKDDSDREAPQFTFTYKDAADAVETEMTVTPQVIPDADNRFITYELDVDDVEGREYYVTITLPSGLKYVLEGGLRTLPLNDTTTFILTKTFDMHIQKDWRDYALKDKRNTGTTDAWLNTLTLYRKLYQESEQTRIAIAFPEKPRVTSDADNILWTITVPGLPMYAVDGSPIEYSITENEDAVKYDGEANVLYSAQYKNPYTHSSPETAVYDGGTIIGSISESIPFQFYKIWDDGEADPANRPNVTFSLYRYVKGVEGSSYEDASPIGGGADRMTWNTPEQKASRNDVVTFVADDFESTPLPRFDENGREYVYLLKEKMTDPGDYKLEVTPPAGSAACGNYILNGGTATNVLKDNLTISATKTWKAKAIQGMHADVVLGLERRLSGTDEPWIAVQNKDTVGGSPDDTAPVTLVMSGFTAEIMTLSGSFAAALPEYNDRGQQYEYRVVEREVTLRTNDMEEGATASGLSRDNDTITVGEYAFRVTYDGNNVTNTLIGETEILVCKNWAPDIPVDSAPPIEVEISREPDDNFVLTAENLPEKNATLVADQRNRVVLSRIGTGTDALFRHLPRYNDEGLAYTYYVKETSTQHPYGNTVYYFNDLTYSTKEVDIDGKPTEVRAAIITNVMGGDGYALSFEVTKQWLDDGDLLHREPITIELVYNAPDGQTSETVMKLEMDDEGADVTQGEGETSDMPSGILDDRNQWYTRIVYHPDTTGSDKDDRKNIENYTIKETKVGEHSVSGNVVYTDEHIYEVIEKRTGVSAGKTTAYYVIQNRRVGTLTIDLTKTWQVGTNEAFDYTAGFRLFADGQAIDSPEMYQQYAMEGAASGTSIETNGETHYVFELKKHHEPDVDGGAASDMTSKLTIGPLRKYDDQGRIINYEVSEFSLNDTPFSNNAITINDHTIVSSCVPGAYIVGDRHTNDKMSYSFTNLRTRSATLYAWKLWRDDGPRHCRRPDIAFDLYRTTTVDENGDPTNAYKVASVDKEWFTKVNDWLWRCEFNSMPLYDANGERYIYFVKERIIQSASTKYVKSYVTGPAALRVDADAQDTTEVYTGFGNAGNGYALAGQMTANGPDGQAGIVINTMADTETQSGRKYWLNVPSWGQPYLPQITVHLQRQRYVYDGSPAFDNSVETLTSTCTVDGTTLTYAFPDMPLYDEYGHRYQYSVAESYPESLPEGIDVYRTVCNGMIARNTYVGGANVSFEAKKTWDWSAYVPGMDGQNAYPEVTFVLEQYIGTTLVKRFEQKIGPGTITSATGTETVRFINTEAKPSAGADRNAFPCYAPNGQAYTYKIYEIPVSGYAVSPMPKDTPYVYNARELVNGQTYTAEFNNKYTPEKTVLEATKIWSGDARYAQYTRPQMDMNQQEQADSSPVRFTFYRKVEGSDTSVKLDGTVYWKVNSADSNQWIATFVPVDPKSLPAYTTDGKAYKYYVVETLSEPYDEVYSCASPTSGEYDPTDSSGDPESDMQITNSLNTVNLYVKKDWKMETSEGVFTATYDQLCKFGTLLDEIPNWITFMLGGAADVPQVFYLDATTNQNRTNRVSVQQSIGNDVCIFTGLPRYYVQDGTRYEAKYTLTEQSLTYTNEKTDSRNGNMIGTFTVSGSGEASSQEENRFYYSFTNTAEALGIHLVKVWNPVPSARSITYTVLNTVSNTSTPVELKTPYKDSGVQAEVFVPQADREGNRLAYQILEHAPTNGYTATRATRKDGTGELTAANVNENGQPYISGVDSSGLYGFVNEKFISIAVQKQWLGDDALSDLTRPESVTVQLTRNNTAENPFEPRSAFLNSDNYWSCYWSNDLPAYRLLTSEKIDDAAAEAQQPYEYRVEETTVDPEHYSVQYLIGNKADSSALITGSESMNSQQEVTIQNKLQLASLTIEKQWTGDKKAIGDRPQVSYKLYRQCEDEDCPLHKKWIAFETGTLPEIVNGANVWSKTIQVPIKDRFGHRLYYRAVEDTGAGANDIGKLAGYTPLCSTTTALTPVGGAQTNTLTLKNKLKAVSVTVTKQWPNDTSEYAYGTRPTQITLTLQRATSADGPWNTDVYVAVATPKNDWTVKWNGLPAYTNANGMRVPLYYRVIEKDEDIPAGYSSSVITNAVNASEYQGDNEADRKITLDPLVNTMKPVAITVTKNWVDAPRDEEDDPKCIQVVLQRKTDSTIWADLTASTLSAANGWTYTWSDLPAYTGTGAARTEFSYRVMERNSSDSTKVDLSDYTVRYSSKSSPTGSEVTSTSSPALKGSVWMNGTAAVTITNTRKPLEITVAKAWDEPAELKASGKATLNIRPAHLTIHLYRRSTGDAELVKTDTLNTASGKLTFPNLPSYDASGDAYTYWVTEALTSTDGQATSLLPGYTPSGNGKSAEMLSTSASKNSSGSAFVLDLGLTNTLNTVSMSAKKQWNHGSWDNDAPGVVVYLTLQYRLGESGAWQSYERKATDENGDITFAPLPKYGYAPGSDVPVEYQYRIIEANADVPAGYVVSPLPGNTEGIAATELLNDGAPVGITNALKPISIQAIKEWEGDDAVKADTRPTSITLKLWRKTDTSDWMLVPFSEADTTGNTNTVTLSIDRTGSGVVTHTWSGLPAYTTTASGARVKYLYKVTEEPIAGYTTGITDADGFDLTDSLVSGLKQCTVTNTLNPISISVNKEWLDDAGADSHSDSVTVSLYRRVFGDEKVLDESTYQRELTLSGSNNWSGSFPNLPTHTGDGKKYLYWLVETSMERYDTTYAVGNGDASDKCADISVDIASENRSVSVTVNNALKPIRIQVTKTWTDQSDALNTRPDDLALTLKRTIDGENVDTVNVLPSAWTKNGDTWTCTYSDLPAYDEAHQEYRYWVEEAIPGGYRANNGGKAVAQPASGFAGCTMQLALGNVLETISIPATKKWFGDADWTADRPGSVRLTLQRKVGASGIWQDYGTPIQINRQDGDTWSDTTGFTNLPRYVNLGGALTPCFYRVIEAAGDVADGYTAMISRTIDATDKGNDDTIFVTNTLTGFSIQATKEWEGDDAVKADTRPTSITLKLWRKTDTSDWMLVPFSEADTTGNTNTVTLSIDRTGSGVVTHTWSGLPAYTTTASGARVKYLYKVTEEPIAGYTTGITDADGFDLTDSLVSGLKQCTVTNTLNPISISVNKEWLDDAGADSHSDSVTVSLYRRVFGDEKVLDESTYQRELTLSGSNNWSGSFPNLPTHTGDGKKYLYWLVETSMERYDTTYAVGNGDASDKCADISVDIASENRSVSVTVNNALKPIRIQVTKTWTDQSDALNTRPDDLALTLKRTIDGENVDTVNVLPSAWTKNGDTWTCTYSDLPAYDEAHQEYRYWVEEAIPGGYRANNGGKAVAQPASGFAGCTMQLALGNVLETISIPATKKWFGDADWTADRPGSVRLTLQRKVGASGIWQDYGTPIQINRQDGDTWSDTTGFTNLPRYVNLGGALTPCFYRVIEAAGDVADGYTAMISRTIDATDKGNDDTIFVTNTLTGVSITVTKRWQDDASVWQLTRPADISLTLERRTASDDWETVPASPTWEPKDGDTWIAQWDGLPAYTGTGEAREAYVYRVTEESISGYATTYGSDDDLSEDAPELAVTGDDGIVDADVTINNRLIPLTIEVTKTWQDDSNDLGVRPEDITLTLYRSTSDDEDAEWTLVSDATCDWDKTQDDTWVATFEGLPAYVDASTETENGTIVTRIPYFYKVEETEVPGYDRDYTTDNTIDAGAFDADAAKIGITNTLRTISITGAKRWVDNAAAIADRPDEIVVELWRSDISGKAYRSATVVVDENGAWTYAFDRLPTHNSDGTPLAYTVREVPIAGYTASYSADGERFTANGNVVDATTVSDSASVDIRNTLDSTSVHADKHWLANDADEALADDVQPDSIELKLERSTDDATWSAVDSQLASADNDWSVDWENLPTYTGTGSDRKALSYRVVEVVPDGYTDDLEQDDEGFHFANTLDVCSITAEKRWADGDMAYDARPESVVFALEWSLDDGISFAELRRQNATEASEWKTVFSALPVYAQLADGTRIQPVYRVVESDVPKAYGVTYDDCIIRNPARDAAYTAAITNTLNTTSLDVQKVWEDQDDRYETRPDSVTVYLQRRTDAQQPFTSMPDADGKPISAVLDARGEWHAAFTGLPAVDSDGNAYTYRVAEADVIGYTSSPALSETQDGKPLCILTNALETTVISGSKTWDDQDDRFGLRPEEITIELYFGDRLMNATRATAETGWRWRIEGLPKYDANGDAIRYTAIEQPVPAYDTDIIGTAITNSLRTTTIAGSKTWDDAGDQDGKRPDEIVIHLLQNGRKFMEDTVTADDGWRWSFDDVPVCDESGMDYIYTITEEPVPDYSTRVEGYDVTNSYTPAETSRTVTKLWLDNDDQDGKRPDSIQVQLLADGKAYGDAIELNAASGWKHTWEHLPQKQAGQLVTYTVQELDEIAGYTTSYSEDTFTIANTHEIETITISGFKTWDDADDKDGIRPETISIYLLADGRTVDTRTVTETDGWRWTFDDLPRYASGAEILYTIAEDPVAGYEAAIDGFDIVNRHVPTPTRRPTPTPTATPAPTETPVPEELLTPAPNPVPTLPPQAMQASRKVINSAIVSTLTILDAVVPLFGGQRTGDTLPYTVGGLTLTSILLLAGAYIMRKRYGKRH